MKTDADKKWKSSNLFIFSFLMLFYVGKCLFLSWSSFKSVSLLSAAVLNVDKVRLSLSTTHRIGKVDLFVIIGSNKTSLLWASYSRRLFHRCLIITMFISCQILLILLLKTICSEPLGRSRRIWETVNTFSWSLSYKGVIVCGRLFCDVLSAKCSLSHYSIKPILLVPALSSLICPLNS